LNAEIRERLKLTIAYKCVYQAISSSELLLLITKQILNLINIGKVSKNKCTQIQSYFFIINPPLLLTFVTKRTRSTTITIAKLEGK
jgi:hypothetical protein